MSSSKPPDEVLAEFRAAVTAREAMDTSEQATTSKTGIFSRPMYQQQRVSEQHRIAQGGRGLCADEDFGSSHNMPYRYEM